MGDFNWKYYIPDPATIPTFIAFGLKKMLAFTPETPKKKETKPAAVEWIGPIVGNRFLFMNTQVPPLI